MYPLPTSKALPRDLAAELDDRFLTSDPSGHFRVRLAALTSASVPQDFSGPLAARVQELLGPASALLTNVDARVVQMQVAIEALAVRHQIAEALLRLIHAVLHAPRSDDRSVWVALTDTPTRMRDVIEQNRETLGESAEEAYRRMADLLLPLDTGTDAASIEESREIHVEWINFAIALMLQRNPDLNAAHNKFKHGLAVRAQDDLLLAVSKAAPTPDGTIEASALNGPDTARLLDGVTLELLARQPKKKGQAHGLELTQMQTDPAATIAEAGALMLTHALLFHQAAAVHFASRSVPRGRQAPPFPGRFDGGPRPGKSRAHRPFALRFSLSLPVADGGSAKPELFWTDGARQELVFGARQQVRVIDIKAD